SVSVTQQAPAQHPTLRSHHIDIGLYDLTPSPTGERLVRRDRVEVEVSGATTAVPALVGTRAADLLLLNDEDLSYTKLRLDERSLATVTRHISGLETSLARALCWSATFDLVRDGELPARTFVALACRALPQEPNINLTTATLAQTQLALTNYIDPAWIPTGWRLVADTARAAFAAAAPGSGAQLAWVRAFATATRSADDQGLLRDWLAGVRVPEGLRIEAELRWSVLFSLVATGGADMNAIEAELDRDRTANGERAAAQARALIPTPESKAETWRRLTTDSNLPNWLQRSLLLGFQHPAQVELVAPYAGPYFDVVADVWATRDSEIAQEFAYLAFPAHQPTQAIVDTADRWLASSGHPVGLRRLVAEGRDGALRSMRARATDARSSTAHDQQ
ncbi:MAG: ERAP1-like C-terminal domain-containing protein, partial [Sporichthyaceae bacterium]|nr:ERAP1-like C-terminal domain-containing protein [Sporichthyaceae bacterium]